MQSHAWPPSPAIAGSQSGLWRRRPSACLTAAIVASTAPLESLPDWTWGPTKHPGLVACRRPSARTLKLRPSGTPFRDRCSLHVDQRARGAVAAVPVGFFWQFGLPFGYVAFQAALNLYMKHIMSFIRIAPGLHGVPASFLVTGLQQLVGVGLFMLILARRRARHSLKPSLRNLRGRELRLVILLAIAFAGNMSLNLFSLAFIPLSVNQVIRACTPLMTAILQVSYGKAQHISRWEWFFMVVGVFCATTTVVAKTRGNFHESGSFVFGTCLCVLSVLFGASDLLLKQVIGSEFGMSSKDVTGYIALPSFLLLLLPAVLWSHPLPDEWHLQLGITATDFDVVRRASALRPVLLLYIMLSGVLAFGYNTFTAFCAVKLSPTTTSLVGNLPTSTLISLLWMERTLRPAGAWGVLLWASIVGNVGAVWSYNAVKRRRLQMLG